VDHRPAPERPQVAAGQADLGQEAPGLGVGEQERLEPPVDRPPLDPVGLRAAAQRGVRLHHRHRAAGPRQPVRARQAGQPAADHQALEPLGGLCDQDRP
jgi:hypothetical protein